MKEETRGEGPSNLDDDDVGDVSKGDLQALLDEHETQALGAAWLKEIQEAAPRVARQYSPSVYARAGSWNDDAIRDLVQDVVERMISKGQVGYICDVANDFSDARALIYHQVRLTLIDRRQRTAVDNLYLRARERLGQPPFAEMQKKPRTWGLAAAPTPRTHYTRRLTAALAALPRLPGNGAERASAIWTTETLLDALTLICRAVGEVEEADLKRILEEALTVFATAEVVLDEAGSENYSRQLEPGELVMANDLVERLVQALTQEEATVLAGKWIGDSDGDIARRLGVSRPTAAKYKESAFGKVRDELSSQSEAVVGQVFERLQSLVIAKSGGGAS